MKARKLTQEVYKPEFEMEHVLMDLLIELLQENHPIVPNFPNKHIPRKEEAIYTHCTQYFNLL